MGGEKRRRLLRSSLLWTGLGALLLLAAAGYLFMGWREYRRELYRSPAAVETPPPPPGRVAFSRFTPREIRGQGLDVFRLERSRKVPAAKQATTSSEDPFEVLGVIRAGIWRVVVRLAPQGRLAALAPGETAAAGMQVVAVSSSRVILRDADGKERRYKVFRLDEAPPQEKTQRSQP